MVMMLWSFTLKEMLIEGIPEGHRAEGPMYHRLLLMYAATLTAICGFATVRIVRFRRALASCHSQGGRPFSDDDDDDDDDDGGKDRTSIAAAATFPAIPSAGDGVAVVRCSDRPIRRRVASHRTTRRRSAAPLRSATAVSNASCMSVATPASLFSG